MAPTIAKGALTGDEASCWLDLAYKRTTFRLTARIKLMFGLLFQVVCDFMDLDIWTWVSLKAKSWYLRVVDIMIIIELRVIGKGT